MSREEILKQMEHDLRVLARNHKVEVRIENPDVDGDFLATLTGANVPLVNDMRMLAEAYGLVPAETVESDDGWGYTSILIAPYEEVKEPSTMLRTLCGACKVYEDLMPVTV